MSTPNKELIATLSKQLSQTGDFLSLTRQYEYSMPAFSFDVSVNNAQQHNVQHHGRINTIKVSVFDTGIIEFSPNNDHLASDSNADGSVIKKSSKDIVLSSAVHGNETAPIEICADLIQQIILGKLALTQRVLFIFGNPASINIGQRFVEENLNRLFSGAHSIDQGQGAGLINKERHRALLLENTVRDFFNKGTEISDDRQRYHYDLHTAIRGSKNDKFAVYPFRHGQPWKEEQLQFLLACGINTVLLSHSPTTTFSYFSSNEFGADAFTVELGKVMPFGENDMTNFKDAYNSLKHLLNDEVLPLKPFDASEFSIFEIDQTINRTQENFTLHFADDVENFTDFPINTVIATDGELEITTKKQGEAIIFPNADVAIGQRALLTVVPTSLN